MAMTSPDAEKARSVVPGVALQAAASARESSRSEGRARIVLQPRPRDPGSRLREPLAPRRIALAKLSWAARKGRCRHVRSMRYLGATILVASLGAWLGACADKADAPRVLAGADPVEG